MADPIEPKLPPHPPTFTPCEHRLIPSNEPGVLVCAHCPWEVRIENKRTPHDRP